MSSIILKESFQKKKLENYGFPEVHLLYSFNLKSNKLNIIKYSFYRQFSMDILSDIYRLNFNNIKKGKNEVYDFISFINNEWVYPYRKRKIFGSCRTCNLDGCSNCLSIYHNNGTGLEFLILGPLRLLGASNTVRKFDQNRVEYMSKLLSRSHYREIQSVLLAKRNELIKQKNDFNKKRRKSLESFLGYSIGLFQSSVQALSNYAKKNPPKCKGSLNITVKAGTWFPRTTTSFIVQIYSNGFKNYYKDKKEGGSGFFESSSIGFYNLCPGEYGIYISGFDKIGKITKSATINYNFLGNKKNIVYNLSDESIIEHK